jgi:uncharacterized membrane protein YfcA
MTLGDWSTSATNALIGFFLGMAGYGLAKLLFAGAWSMAFAVILPFAALFVFISLFDGLTERIFPSGIRPARTPGTPDRKPMARRLSFPAGFLLGALAGVLGLSDQILGAL